MPTAGLCRVVWVAAGEAGERGCARGIIRVVVGGSEVVEEGQHGVRGSVAADWCAGLGEAVEGLLLQGEVGVLWRRRILELSECRSSTHCGMHRLLAPA